MAPYSLYSALPLNQARRALVESSYLYREHDTIWDAFHICSAPATLIDGLCLFQMVCTTSAYDAIHEEDILDSCRVLFWNVYLCLFQMVCITSAYDALHEGDILDSCSVLFGMCTCVYFRWYVLLVPMMQYMKGIF
jgi:hypothetical protein